MTKEALRGPPSPPGGQKRRWSLGFASEVGAGRQSRGTEQVARRVWSCLQVDCVRTQRDGRAPRGGRRGPHDVGEACMHVVSRSVRSTALCVRSKNKENTEVRGFPARGGRQAFFTKDFHSCEDKHVNMCKAFRTVPSTSKVLSKWAYIGFIQGARKVTHGFACVTCVLSRVQLSVTPRGCSPPGSSGQGILQARILEWVVISFSRGSSWPRDQTWSSALAGGSFTVWATKDAPRLSSIPSSVRTALAKDSFGFFCRRYGKTWTNFWAHPILHFFTRSSVDAHGGCRHALAVVNGAAPFLSRIAPGLSLGTFFSWWWMIHKGASQVV